MSVVIFGFFMSAILAIAAFALSAGDGDGLSSA